MEAIEKIKLIIPKNIAEITEEPYSVYQYGVFDPCPRLHDWIWEKHDEEASWKEIMIKGKTHYEYIEPENPTHRYRENIIKAYLNPLTRLFVEIGEDFTFK